MDNDKLNQIAKELDAPPEALKALVVGIGTMPALGWLFENVREFCEEIQPRSLLELRAEKKSDT